MILNMAKAIPFLLGLTLLAACTHKTELAPNNNYQSACDTIGITYVDDIQPIFSDNCYSCHATAVVENDGLDLQDTVSLKNYLQLGFRGDSVYGSKLYHCMLHANLAQPMPPTYVVDSCSLNKVQYWLRQGAPI